MGIFDGALRGGTDVEYDVEDWGSLDEDSGKESVAFLFRLSPFSSRSCKRRFAAFLLFLQVFVVFVSSFFYPTHRLFFLSLANFFAFFFSIAW